MYWLRLLKDSDISNEKVSGSLVNHCDELLKITGTIINTMKVKLNQCFLIPNSKCLMLEKDLFRQRCHHCT